MEQATAELSRSLYADYGAFAFLVLVNIATMWLMFRYFTAELRACREQREQSENDWKRRHDALTEKMINQVVSQSATLERLADKLK